jgi:hypothetical protein
VTGAGAGGAGAGAGEGLEPELEIYDLNRVPGGPGGGATYTTLLFQEDGRRYGKPVNSWLLRMCGLEAWGDAVVFSYEVPAAGGAGALAGAARELPSLEATQQLLRFYAIRARRVDGVMLKVARAHNLIEIGRDEPPGPASASRPTANAPAAPVFSLKPLLMYVYDRNHSGGQFEMDPLTLDVKRRTLALLPSRDSLRSYVQDLVSQMMAEARLVRDDMCAELAALVRARAAELRLQQQQQQQPRRGQRRRPRRPPGRGARDGPDPEGPEGPEEQEGEPAGEPEDDPEGEECATCLNPTSQRTPCAHVVCRPCMRRWKQACAQRSPRVAFHCPLCRRQL